MMRKMVSGQPQPLPTLSTRAHGSRRLVVYSINKCINCDCRLVLIACFACVQKIKNPNYKGKWKAPMIDNPGYFMFNLKHKFSCTCVLTSTF